MCRLCGIPPRRCWASLMISSGDGSQTHTKVVGHGSATLTLDAYEHLMDDRLNDVMDRTMTSSPTPSVQIRQQLEIPHWQGAG